VARESLREGLWRIARRAGAAIARRPRPVSPEVRETENEVVDDAFGRAVERANSKFAKALKRLAD